MEGLLPLGVSVSIFFSKFLFNLIFVVQSLTNFLLQCSSNRHLRDLFRVDPADYMLAICGNGTLRELSSPGKSGSFFYLTQDDRFMIKTVKKSEVKVCCII